MIPVYIVLIIPIIYEQSSTLRPHYPSHETHQYTLCKLKISRCLSRGQRQGSAEEVSKNHLITMDALIPLLSKAPSRDHHYDLMASVCVDVSLATLADRTRNTIISFFHMNPPCLDYISNMFLHNHGKFHRFDSSYACHFLYLSTNLDVIPGP